MRLLKAIVLLSIVFFTACDGDDEVNKGIEVPATYTFERNGESTVSFSGQTDRLDMLSEIKTYIKNGDAGSAVEASKLNDMFTNQNDPFTSADLNASTKQLEDKTFLTYLDFFKELFKEAEVTSADVVENGTVASEGVAGRIERGTSGNFILVNEKGWEFTQFVEKGLMGAVFLNQIFNSYLTDSKVGASVDNESLVEGKNYTTREHHFDEAFGYWGVPVDFPSELSAEDKRFWANYSYGRESVLGSATKLKNAFLAGRTAIVNDDQETLNAQVEIIYEEFELLVAATAIHYINEAIANYNTGDKGNLFHHLSEGYGFVMALRYSPKKAIANEQIDSILNTRFGTDGDFWTVDLDGLNKAKSVLVTMYPGLADFADEL